MKKAKNKCEINHRLKVVAVATKFTGKKHLRAAKLMTYKEGLKKRKELSGEGWSVVFYDPDFYNNGNINNKIELQ